MMRIGRNASVGKSARRPGVSKARPRFGVARPVGERYTPERKAEFLLCNAVDAEDYAAAVREVREMGLDPARIPHDKPPGA